MVDIALAYLPWLATTYAATMSIYFGLGFALSRINERFPERRIQKDRFGEVQARQEIRKSFSALLVTSLCLSFGLFAQDRGWTQAPLDTLSPAAPLTLIASMLIFDAWFYFGHRLQHARWFYRWHATHHRSIAPTPWSNDNSTMPDTLVVHSYYAIATFILPIPPVMLVGHRLYDQITGMVGHSGFEYFAGRAARWPSPMVCTTFHDLHHSRFRYNYGNFTSIWDRLMGTLSPGYDEAVKALGAPGEGTSAS